MGFLFDTNIFLEILLDQEKKDEAKRFIASNLDQLYISDFSFHSIGLILIKQKKFQVFSAFLTDLIPHTIVLSLPKEKYSDLNLFAEKHAMDFDDSYQTLIAKEYDMELITMDNDFLKVRDFIKVRFL